MLRESAQAPAFDLDSDAGRRVSLADFRGKPVVVYFYPRDNTPGCTREAIAFSQAQRRFAALGAAVVGISKDSVASHCKFRDAYGLTIPLLSDPDLAVHKAFGAFGEKTMYGKKVEGVIRSTFVVDPKGKIAKVFSNVKVDGHVDQVLAALGGAAPTVGGKASKKASAKEASAKKVLAKKVPAKKALKKAPAKRR